VSWPLWAVLVAASPIVLLAVLVLRDQPVTRTAWLAAGVAGVAAVLVFGLDLGEVALGVVRGLWTGSWILLIVLPALLLYEILDRSGALDRLSEAADLLAPTEGRGLLLLAFALPSFLQGAAGFGAPIAMSAPLLVRRGMAPVAAVAACLIGYQWSVTFGSMGSSYFMAEATARLSPEAADSFALRAALVLAVTALVSGFLVLTRGERAPGDRWRALVIGLVMGGVLVGVATVQPALGSTSAGLAGLLACWVVLPARGARRPRGGDLVVAASPYAVLTAAAVIGFAVPPVRALFDRLPAVGPVLPGVDAAFGYRTTATAVTPVFRPLLHPLPYVLLAILVAIIVYRRRGWWPVGGTRAAIVGWLPRARRVGASILGLTVLAAVLTEAGMVAALASALAGALGLGFVVVSAPLGALGTVITGSTTASNALFSSLQAEVAVVLGLLPAMLLSGQTAGGNIGNTLAPAPAAVGAASVGAGGQEGAVLRRNLAGAGILLATVLATLSVQLWLLTAGGA
jgi:lactate permease